MFWPFKKSKENENANTNQQQVENDDKKEPEKSIGSLLSSILSSVRVGTDVLSAGISLPSWIYEPLSILQRQCEMLEYSHLLDKASECVDPLERMAYVVAFAVSAYPATQRYHNNFNPILGETYEYVDENRGFSYLAEQVSHHPPISATHAISKNWIFYQNSNPKTNFMGNAIEIDTQGRTHIYFPNSKDHYYYTNPKTRMQNLLLGKMWIEHHGELKITNLKNGDNCKVNFQKCGFFGNSAIKNIQGIIRDSEENEIIELKGEWDSYIEANWLNNTKDSEKNKNETLWRITEDNFLGGLYNFTKFAAGLNYLDERLENILPPTDSRLRHDRRKLEGLEYDVATRMKKMLEERQRADKKTRVEAGQEWVPQWFHKIPDEDGGHTWVYSGDYWDQREQKIKNMEEGIDTSELLNGGNAKKYAC